MLSKDQELIELLNTVFDVDLYVTEYKTSTEIEQIIKSGNDFEVIIGGAYAMEICDTLQRKGVLWETGYDTIYLKIKECIKLIKVRKELCCKNQLNTILDCAHDGIIYLDKKKLLG